MGRGFWPGLCVSLKHNSKFASFNILSKGDYPAELNIPIPFSLVSNDVSKDQLIIMPGYWFLYNMYALARNAWKYVDRDKRTDRIQQMEYDYLAPDTINEIFTARLLMETCTGNAYTATVKTGERTRRTDNGIVGKKLLKSGNKIVDELEISAENIENSKRKVVLIKVLDTYQVFEELVVYYGMMQLLQFQKENVFKTFEELIAALPAKAERTEWLNLGGQLIPTEDINTLKEKIRNGKIRSWDAVHDYYKSQGEKYPLQKLKHALASLSEITGIRLKKMDTHQFTSLLSSVVATREWMAKCIYDSRAKDYSSPYRRMVYENIPEMNEVLGKLEENSFIKQQLSELQNFKKEITALKKRFKL
jgi:hypothetical protein